METSDRGTLVIRDYFGNPASREDCERLLDDYYDERGWDIETGIPTEKTLIESDLAGVTEELKQIGIINWYSDVLHRF